MMMPVKKSVALIGAGVSGLTCGVVFAEAGYRATIFADQVGMKTTSAAAGAIWFPYDAEPAEAVIAWALETYGVLAELARDSGSGVSMIELRTVARSSEIQIPDWAHPLGARTLDVATGLRLVFQSGFVLQVPLTDTTIYLDYLAERFHAAGGNICGGVRFGKVEEVDAAFDLIINCAGIGACTLVPDPSVEPHRGQVALVPKLDLEYAIVCDDTPLMYAIPRAHDCVFGGTNDLSDNSESDPASTDRIVAECSCVLGIARPEVLGARVGLRPFRQTGVRVTAERTSDGRALIHNYGHGGSGFTLSWGCARQVLDLVSAAQKPR